MFHEHFCRVTVHIDLEGRVVSMELFAVVRQMRHIVGYRYSSGEG